MTCSGEPLLPSAIYMRRPDGPLHLELAHGKRSTSATIIGCIITPRCHKKIISLFQQPHIKAANRDMTSMQQQQFISPFSVENIISKKADKDSDETLNHSSSSSTSYGKFVSRKVTNFQTTVMECFTLPRLNFGG